MLATEDQPLVSNDLLAELASPDFNALRGEFDAKARALLATALPEICGELLRWREAAEERPNALAMALRSQAVNTRLDAARSAIRSASWTSESALAEACETLLRHSTDTAERAAAADVLTQMREAA